MSSRRLYWICVCDYCAVLSFFFSSRRRHTRFDCDWSSDVCSSDLFTTSLFSSGKTSARTSAIPSLSATILADSLRSPVTTTIRNPSFCKALMACGVDAFIKSASAIAPASFSFTATRTIVAAKADRKSTRLNSSHSQISYAVFCLKKKKPQQQPESARRHNPSDDLAEPPIQGRVHDTPLPTFLRRGPPPRS